LKIAHFSGKNRIQRNKQTSGWSLVPNNGRP